MIARILGFLSLSIHIGGQLSDYLPTPHQDRPLPPSAVIQIMHQTCRAVQHMHSQNPPIMHRDLKIENLLLSDKFIIKLCDFGSASTVMYNPDSSWTAVKRGAVQEEVSPVFHIDLVFRKHCNETRS